MVAATRARNTRSKITQGGGIGSAPVAASTIIYKGSIVAISAAGYAIPATDTAGLLVVGIAHETVDNSAGAAGAKVIRYVYGRRFNLTASGTINQSSVGDMLMVADDSTVTDATTATNDIAVGTCVEYVSATEVWVEVLGRRSAT